MLMTKHLHNQEGFLRSCNLHYISHFAPLFIIVENKTSFAESCKTFPPCRTLLLGATQTKMKIWTKCTETLLQLHLPLNDNQKIRKQHRICCSTYLQLNLKRNLVSRYAEFQKNTFDDVTNDGQSELNDAST